MDKEESESNRENNVKILIITAPETRSGWGRYTIDLAEAIKKEDAQVFIEHIESPISFKKNFLLSPYYALKIYFKHRRDNIDIIHCVIEPYAFIAKVISAISGIPYVITLHGTYSVIMFSHPLYGKLQRYAYKSASGLIAVSEYTKSRVNEFLPGLDVIVIPNGISSKPVVAPRELSGSRILLGVGGVKHRKGYHLVIEALGKIKEEIALFTYYIVGAHQDKKYVENLKELITKNGLDDKVVLTNSISGTELDDLYGRTDLFILTPVSEGLRFEGFGLVYLEANTKGIPVIGMKGSGAEEAVKSDYNGLLAEEGDIEDLASKIKSLLLDPNLYQKISKNALEWVKEMQWSIVIKRYKSIYGMAISKNDISN